MTIPMSTDLDRRPAPIDPSTGVVVHVAGDLYLSLDSRSADGKLDQILAQLRTHTRLLEQLMSKADEMLADLETANTTTNEIADDLDALIAKQAAGGLSPEEATAVDDQIKALGVRLRGVADKYPPTTP